MRWLLVNVKQEGSVSFSVRFVGFEGRADFPQPRFVPGQTDDGTFRLYVDVDSIQQVRFNAFTFTAYVADAKPGGQKAAQFQITGNPTGSFRDAPVRVSFHIKDTGSNATGVILMPVYNATKTDLLQVEEQKEPAYVSISGNSPVLLRMGNVPDAPGISVTNLAVSEGCPKCWKRISSTVNEKNPQNIEPGSNATLAIDLLPNTIPALMQGALVIKPDIPHDTLTLMVTYHTVPGGADKKQSVPLKIRFGPGLLGLALALCGGIVLGLTARYLLTGKLGKDGEKAVHAISCVRSCSCWASSRYKLEKNQVAPSSNGPSWWIATARGPSCLFWTPGGLCMNSGWQRTALKNSRVSLCPPRSRLQT
jgi:hypothetical protein